MALTGTLPKVPCTDAGAWIHGVMWSEVTTTVRNSQQFHRGGTEQVLECAFDMYCRNIL